MSPNTPDRPDAAAPAAPAEEPIDAPTPRATPAAKTLRGYRRTAIVVLVASLSITAVVGIVTLLSGDFGEVQGRVLGTTLLIAGASILALCHLTVLARPVRVVGFVGLAASAVVLVIGLVLIWTPWYDNGGGWPAELWRWFGITSIVAVSLAHANLLLQLSGRRRRAVRVSLWITLAAIAVVAVMLVIPLLTDWNVPGDEGETYWRWFGVIAIVDALGTIVLPVVALLIREQPATATVLEAAPAATDGPAAASAPDALEQRIAELAARTGLERAALIGAALDAFEARIDPDRG
ncbi:hypothetical protein SAMN05428970_3085 [Agromyces sp. CF514]|uniref:hypothetical protein n=1 Tax=Agromyces sp. CF514 TaxID=1881031 RepID=UPI0008F39EC6|nr:hypothetical protein [Agromyces sp. CF514]SFR84935.1 hypothetical protein SAMN05428970_3085 [Agromyces sp. CF514]